MVLATTAWRFFAVSLGFKSPIRVCVTCGLRVAASPLVKLSCVVEFWNRNAVPSL